MSPAPPIRVQVPLAHMGTVNVWLLRGEPLALVDTGIRGDAALAALERGLAHHGVALDQIELVIATHHHVDHVGLATTIRRASGAILAMHHTTAARCAIHDGVTETDRAYCNALMARHGIPAALIAENEPFWDLQRVGTASFEADVVLRDGETIRAGRRDLCAIARPGHSSTDTLYVDETDGIAFVGDHLLATISSNTEILPGGGPRPRVAYLDGLHATARATLRRVYAGHGDAIGDPSGLIARRLREHELRTRAIADVLRTGPGTVYSLARALWPETTIRRQPLLVTWEVLGHLDVLAARGAAHEQTSADGQPSFALAPAFAA